MWLGKRRSLSTDPWNAPILEVCKSRRFWSRRLRKGSQWNRKKTKRVYCSLGQMKTVFKRGDVKFLSTLEKARWRWRIDLVSWGIQWPWQEWFQWRVKNEAYLEWVQGKNVRRWEQRDKYTLKNFRIKENREMGNWLGLDLGSGFLR